MNAAYSGTHNKMRRRAKRHFGPGRAALLVLIVLAIVVIVKKAGLSPHVTVPKTNIETDFGVELSALPSKELTVRAAVPQTPRTQKSSALSRAKRRHTRTS